MGSKRTQLREEPVNSIASTVKAELEGAQASVDGALSSAKAKAGK